MKPSDTITDEIREAAIQLAHEMLSDAMTKTRDIGNPMLLVLACSHFLSHIILGAPDEDTVKDCVKTFLTDLDVNGALANARDPKERKRKQAILAAIEKHLADDDEKPASIH